MAKILTLKTNLTISFSHFRDLSISALPSPPHPSSTQAHSLSSSPLTASLPRRSQLALSAHSSPSSLIACPLHLTLSAFLPCHLLSPPRPLHLTLSGSVPSLTLFASPSLPCPLYLTQAHTLFLSATPSLPHSQTFFFLLILTSLKYWVFSFSSSWVLGLAL